MVKYTSKAELKSVICEVQRVLKPSKVRNLVKFMYNSALKLLTINEAQLICSNIPIAQKNLFHCYHFAPIAYQGKNNLLCCNNNNCFIRFFKAYIVYSFIGSTYMFYMRIKKLFSLYRQLNDRSNHSAPVFMCVFVFAIHIIF